MAFENLPFVESTGFQLIEPVVEIVLSVRRPYDWTSLLKFFAFHRMVGLETITDQSYSRIFKLGAEVGWFEVQPEFDALKLRIVVRDSKTIPLVVTRVRQMFDLDFDPLVLAKSFSKEKVLVALLQKFPGLRLARGWDIFEVAICTILGQLVSMDHARRLVEQLIEHYGDEVKHPVTGDTVTLFPSPQVLANADLLKVRTTKARRATINELARKVLAGEIMLTEDQDPALFRAKLLSTKGIGPWTAEYISLRGLGDADAFPGTDLILRRALDLHPNLNLDTVRPWRSYAALYLWQEFASLLSKRKQSKLRAPRACEDGGRG